MRDAPAADPIRLSDYQLRLPSFEGPLDVLLRLIERDQLAITDVSLVAVTDQFLAYLAALAGSRRADRRVRDGGGTAGAAQVALVAAATAGAEEGEPDELVRQLIEYRAMRAAVDQLASGIAGGGGVRPGGGVAVPEAPPPRLVAPEVVALARALRRRLTVVPSPAATWRRDRS